MNTRFRIFTLGLILLFLAACSPTETLPEPTSISLGETSSGPRSFTSTPVLLGACQFNRSYLDNLATSLSFEQVVISYQSYAAEDTLTIWLVSPEINSFAGEQSRETAELDAIQASKTLVDANPCLLEIETLHLTVVDSGYNQWFSGSLRTIDLPNLQTEQTGGGTESEQGGGREALPLNTLPTAGPDECTWQELSSRLKSNFSSRQVEAAFTYVRDAGGNIVYAQWSVPDQGAALKVLDSVMVIASQTSCLHQTASGISVLLTLPDGQTLLSGFLPIPPSQEADPAAFTFNFIPQP